MSTYFPFFLNIILTRMQLPTLHGISLNVFGLWIYLTLMNSCVINTLNSIQLQEHLPACNALIFYPFATASWCMGFALWIHPSKVDFRSGIIQWLLYTFLRHSDNGYVCFSCLFLFLFVFLDNIHFSMSIFSYADYNHSRFREIIFRIRSFSFATEQLSPEMLGS